MAKITKQDIEHVARLSRLKLTNEEKEKFTHELGAILDYVDELESAPTENIELISQTRLPARQVSGLKNIAREDLIEEGGDRDLMLENVPEKQDGFIKVKKVFEK